MSTVKESHEKKFLLPSGIAGFMVEPDGEIRGGIVVIQEIFGLNEHVRSLARRFAEKGFLTLAPAYFDPIEKGVELEYDARGVAVGRRLMEGLGWERPVSDTRDAALELKKLLGEKPIATVGYCWGGSVSWLAACRLGDEINGAVCYYGRHITDFREERPKVPVIMHYGRADASIPLDNVEKIRALHPEIPIHLYDAGHGFGCDARESFEPKSARLALDRTLQFLNSLT